MERLQLFRLKDTLEISEIEKKIMSKLFNKKSQQGFILVGNNENSIEAVYYCKQIKQIPEMNPYHQRIQEVVSYTKLDFVISQKYSLFYLINSSRDSIPLYSIVSKILGLETMFVRYDILSKQIIEKMNESLSLFSITQAIIENIPFTNSVYGNLVLKGTDDIYPLLEKYRDNQIRKISARFSKKDKSICVFSLTNTGRLLCKPEDRITLLNLLASYDVETGYKNGK